MSAGLQFAMQHDGTSFCCHAQELMEDPNARHSRRESLDNAWRRSIGPGGLEIHGLELGWRHSVFAKRIGPRRLTNTERRSSEYSTRRRSLPVRFVTPAISGRSEKLLSESGSRPVRGLEPVRRRFGSASVVPSMDASHPAR